MPYVLGTLVAIFTVLLAIGAITGRVRMTSCCTTVPVECDLRMRPEVSER